MELEAGLCICLLALFVASEKYQRGGYARYLPPAHTHTQHAACRSGDWMPISLTSRNRHVVVL